MEQALLSATRINVKTAKLHAKTKRYNMGEGHSYCERQKEGEKCLNRTATVLKPRGKDLYFAFGWVQSFRAGEKNFSSCRLHLNTFIVDKQIFLFFPSNNFLKNVKKN